MSDKPANDKPARRWLKVPLVYLLVAIVAASSSVLIYAGVQYFYQKQASLKVEHAILDNPASADTKAPPEAVNQLKKTSESFRAVAKKVGPAVVNIKATKGTKKPKIKLGGSKRGGRRGGPQMPPPQDDGEGGMPGDPFFDFFGPFFGQPGPQQDMPQTSLGSGIIIDKNGTVVTNNHVVDGATEILVRLSSEKSDFKAKVIGADAKTDLAVLKIEGHKSGLPVAEWADSDAVEVGDWAVAIGSPFSLDQSVTVGIVSAKGRSQVGLGTENTGGDLLQTDAAINPGNSGGPLCDLDGKVMGINTAIYTRSGGYMGIGFAIPSNLAKDIVSKLIAHGKIVRGWLGVYIQPLDEELGKELGVKEGVGVHEVIEGSPAEAAGIKAGDVVTEVDGKEVKDVNELQKRIGNLKPGESIKMKLVSYADKKSRTVTVKIGELPDEPGGGGGKGGGKDREEEPDKIGLVVSQGKGGIVIDGIQPGSIAEQMLGLEVGDIIIKINRQAVTSVASYKKLINSSKRIYLEVKRHGRTLFFQFVLPQ